MNTTGKIIAGFLIGTAIGTVTGLLLAPSTGKTTRKNINKKARKLYKQLEKQMDGIIGREKKNVTQKVSQAASHVKNGKAPVATR